MTPVADHPDVVGRAVAGRPRRRAGRRLPVAKAMNRSPLVWPPVPPARAMPRPARWASRSHWWGRSGASVATTTMIEPDRRAVGVAPPPGSRRLVVRARDLVVADRLADRHAVDPEPARACRSWPGRATPTVQPPRVRVDDPRRRPDAALELVADHPGAAADVALGDRAAGAPRRAPRRRARPDVEAVDVVEQRRRTSRRRPAATTTRRRAVAPRPTRRRARRGRRRRCACW